MPLTDLSIKNAKPRQKPYKLSDSGGLYLEILPSGGKSFRVKYRFEGKEKRLTIGTYPAVSLLEARQALLDAKKSLSQGIDPCTDKRDAKLAKRTASANTLRGIAEEWFEKKKPLWSKTHAERMWLRLENNVLPWIGNRPIAEIKPLMILDCIRRVESRGSNYMAGRVLAAVGSVYRYAIGTGRVEFDPTQALRDVLAGHVEKHMASVTEPERVGQILRSFDAFSGTFVVKTALSLAPYLFCRPIELRTMKWADLDLKKRVWSLPARSMKMRRDHLVPLSKQAVVLLKSIHPLTGDGEFVFTGGRDPKRPMSNAAVNAALRRLGIDTQDELTGHGFRAMARTMIRERLKVDAEVIECQLSHTKKGSLGAAYDRTQFWDERVVMMQKWADYLDQLKQEPK